MTRNQYNTAVDTHADGLYRFILKSMNDSESAKDVVQEVFTKLWEKHQGVEFEKVKSYLFTSGYRTMIDVIRKNKRIGLFEEIEESRYLHTKQYSDLGELLDQAINRLAPEQRRLVLLRDYEGYSYKEIGEIVNLTESQVKVYIFRARKFLQKYLVSVETII